MTGWLLQHDLRSPDFGTPLPALYGEALAMSAWADGRGCPRVVISEHHGSADGYLPSPFVFAGAVAARTERTRILIAALVLTLRDPIAAAEDALVLDLVSGGRLELVLAPGYVPEECAMFGVPFEARGRIFEEKATAFLAALTGEPFEWQGRTVRVTPGPVQRPRPFVIMGGSAPKRAARLADAYLPPVAEPALAEAYRAECGRLGKGEGILLWPEGPTSVFVTEDPDRSWALLGPHLLHENNSYGEWSTGSPGANAWVPAADVETLRAEGDYAVVTPEEAVALADTIGPGGVLRLKPLVGGLDPALGWESLELFVDRVLPRLGA